jgi:hypothetical protein
VESSDIEQTQPASAPVAAPSEREPASQHELCDDCGAPVDRAQRYCVSCGARRRHVPDPAARHLSGAASKARRAPRPQRAAKKSSSSLGLALVLAVIPLAVGVGVLLGRSSTNGDAQLIAALRAQKPEVITAGGAASASEAQAPSASTTTSVAAVTSTFPLQDGYAVELATLPAHKATEAGVGTAEQAARTKGAKSVGLILQSDFKVTPSPPAGAAVIYSGAFRTRSEAEQALGKLKSHFPGAKVIAVGSSATATASGKVLTKTAYGSAQQITGFKATPSQLAAGQQVVNKVAKKIGGSYVNSQRGLPDQISVP